eukprot:jgi/Phyca11/112753/e_gw1.22.145.1
METVGLASGESCRQIASQDSECTVTESEEGDCSQSSVGSSGENRARVDAYGIPLEIHHYRQLGKRDDVWDIAHVLSSPYASGDDDDAERFTHVCVLCALRLTSHPNASQDAWEGALRKFNHTSNVKDHLVAKHSTHPIGKAEATKRVKRARRQLEEAFSQVPASVTTDTTTVGHFAKGATKPGALQKLWGPSNMQLRAYIANWLINDGTSTNFLHVGLPYNTVASEGFRSLMEVATGKSDVAVLSAQTFNDVLAASFLKFREMTKRLLEMEYTSAFKRPFLNLMHDMWTVSTGKKDAIGTSMSFIDKDWNFRTVALLVTIFKESHDSAVVQQKISSRIAELYDVDIGSMAHFVMSDTAPAARKVSKLYEDAVQVDCAMHVLNLCPVYGLGMRENVKTCHVVNPATNLLQKQRQVCTPGGHFPDGAKLVKKTRDLNNYFKTPQRVERLQRVQQHYGLLELGAMVDCDTRVASTVTLFQRSILNYPAFKAYFQYCEAYDDPKVFTNLSKEDWQTMAQCEAVTHMLADLARIEVQREAQIASELLVLMRLACDRLNATHFRPYDVDALRTPRTTVKTPPRTVINAADLCAGAVICLARVKAQVQKRLANVAAESIVVMLLDPRTKDSIDTLVRCTTGSQDTPATDDDPSRRSLSSLHQEADEVLERWLSHNVHWVQVAVQQANDKRMTAEVMAGLLLVRRNGTVRWSLQGLFKHVDVCRWFKEVGAKQFPSIAALARVWLGRASSNAFQERVFSTGGLIMSPRRTRTDNERAEMQVLLKQNRSEIKRMEPHGGSSVASTDNAQVC